MDDEHHFKFEISAIQLVRLVNKAANVKEEYLEKMEMQKKVK